MPMANNKKGRKINILYVHANNYDVGGADYCMFKMVTSLNPNLYEPVVILRKKTHIYDMYKKAGVKVRVLPVVRLQKTKNIFKLAWTFLLFPASVIMLAYEIMKNKIDIVHSNDLLDFSGSIAAKLTGKKSVQHIRMIVFDNNLIRKIISKFLKIINDRILCVSSGVSRWYFDTENNKAVVLYDWLDMETVGHGHGKTNLRKKLALPEDNFIVGMVSRLEWWKGQHILIESAKKVVDKYPDIQFALVGGTVKGKEQYRLDLLRKIKDFDILANTHLLGERKDILNIISQFDVAIHCSVKPDPFPGVVLEAMECGKPVVGARAGGVPEQIEENVSGLLFEPGDSGELAEKIIYLIENKDVAEKIGYNARKSAQTKFSKEEIISQLENIYITLAKRVDSNE